VAVAENFCPYVGLQSYTDAERDYFFGREPDQRIIVSNLYASSLTILYGESGVGKSSVLLAGVVPYLRSQPRSAIVVFREWQRPDFLEAIKSECLKAAELAWQQPPDIAPSLPFDDLLCASVQSLGGPILLLFDQFEEYFLYHPCVDGSPLARVIFGVSAVWVGAAMCSTCLGGTDMAAGRNAFSAGAGPDQKHALERALG
jgi:hypothetical protein